MKRVYEARDGLEAHMLAGLLEQAGILAQVRGDLLQGAVGELPASGLASIWVAEDDESRSLELIADYEAVVGEIAEKLDAGRHTTALALASVPEKIRGYGPVKDASIDRANATRKELRRAFHAGERPAEAAE